MADCRIWLEKVPLDRSAVVSLNGICFSWLESCLVTAVKAATISWIYHWIYGSKFLDQPVSKEP